MGGQRDPGIAVIFERIAVKLAFVLFFQDADRHEFICCLGIEIEGFDDFWQEAISSNNFALYLVGNTPVHKLQNNITISQVLVFGYFEIVRGG